MRERRNKLVLFPVGFTQRLFSLLSNTHFLTEIMKHLVKCGRKYPNLVPIMSINTNVVVVTFHDTPSSVGYHENWGGHRLLEPVPEHKRNGKYCGHYAKQRF